MLDLERPAERVCEPDALGMIAGPVAFEDPDTLLADDHRPHPMLLLKCPVLHHPGMGESVPVLGNKPRWNFRQCPERWVSTRDP